MVQSLRLASHRRLAWRKECKPPRGGHRKRLWICVCSSHIAQTAGVRCLENCNVRPFTQGSLNVVEISRLRSKWHLLFKKNNVRNAEFSSAALPIAGSDKRAKFYLYKAISNFIEASKTRSVRKVWGSVQRRTWPKTPVSATTYYAAYMKFIGVTYFLSIIFLISSTSLAILSFVRHISSTLSRE